MYPENAAPWAGRRLGDFEVVREVGRGGMGVVFEARQLSLNRRVALKVLSGGLGLTGPAVQRFRREAEAAAKLHHTNIVPVYATGEQDGTHFYAMELVDGSSLDRVVRQAREQSSEPVDLGQTGPYLPAATTPSSQQPAGLEFDAVARMLAEVADALDYAHREGVLHRDIKPSNLLLSPSGRLVLTDFGLARMMEQPGMTVTGEFVGTPLYMAPEQIAAGRMPIDHRADIYSLGATLFELLTLRPPFQGDRRDQVIARVMNEEPPAPRRLNPKIPIELETICLKAMDKNPGRRYQTAGEMADDLRRYLNRFAIRARRAGPLRRLQKWVRRNPALTVAAAAVLLTACAAGFFAWQVRSAERRRMADIEAERRAVALDKAVTAALNGQNDEAERQIAAAVELGAPLGEVSKVRGIIALYGNEPASAITHLTIAAERLGHSVAVHALIAKARNEMSDPRQEEAIADMEAQPPSSAEDFLFKGHMIGIAFDPQSGMRDIEKAIDMRPTPLARLAMAEVRGQFAIDTGSEADAAEAVQDAAVARKLLPNSDLALGYALQAHLVLWDFYNDRAGPGDAARADAQRELAGELVKAAGWRTTYLVLHGCAYYHDRTGGPAAHRKYVEEVWNRSGSEAAGELFAETLFRAGDLARAGEVLDRTLARRGLRSYIEWHLWACLQAKDGRKDSALREVKAQRLTPGYSGLNFALVALLLGMPAESRAICSEALRKKLVPGWRHGWYQSLAEYGASEGGPAADNALLERAGPSRLHLCEAHFHVAMHHLGRGRLERARQHLAKAVKTRVFGYLEYQLADILLARMEAEPGWPTWIPAAR